MSRVARAAVAEALAPRLLLLAAAAGVLAGCAGVLFRLLLNGIQWLAFGSGSELLLSALAGVPGWRVVLAPALGGLAVGLVYRFVIPGHFPLGPADAIEAAWRGKTLPPARSVAGTLINAASLGVGASVGREGPIVLLGAAAGSWLVRRARLAPEEARILLAGGVAACVAASFNAPAAGGIFALEVILLGYRLAPLPALTIASLLGALVGRAWFGGAFGHALALAFPGAVAAPGAYAAIGAAAVAAPVLGAPLSTALIVLEMTEAWSLAPGVAVAAVAATAACRPVSGHSFFTRQLERRGVVLRPE